MCLYICNGKLAFKCTYYAYFHVIFTEVMLLYIHVHFYFCMTCKSVINLNCVNETSISLYITLGYSVNSGYFH